MSPVAPVAQWLERGAYMLESSEELIYNAEICQGREFNPRREHFLILVKLQTKIKSDLISKCLDNVRLIKYVVCNYVFPSDGINCINFV